VGGRIWFVSDRDWAGNVWSYDVASRALEQVTHFSDAEVKWLSGGPSGLVFEQDGWIHTLDPSTGRTQRLDITVRGDFPWAETRWEDVTDRIGSASLSPSGVRALMAARGEVFTVPVEHGDVRNLTRSSGVDDREPVWSPDGTRVAWFSDDGGGYALLVGPQDGIGQPRRIGIGESKMAWEATWSPDGERIAFVDDDVRIRIVQVASGDVTTADVGGVNLERGGMGLAWSPDSKWLAYAKTFPNGFRRIVAWSSESGRARPMTDEMADAQAPAWDRDGRHLYFLASTDLALGSGWANTSAIRSEPTYGAYVMVLGADDPGPFPPRSDEEKPAGERGAGNEDRPDTARSEGPDTATVQVRVDFEDLQRRIVPLPMPVARYFATAAGPKGTVFIAERGEGPGATLHRFSLEDREAKVFVRGAAGPISVSADGKKLLFRSGRSWRVVGTDRPPEGEAGTLDFTLRMR
ncbi:MAG TPA: hypothetical protein VE173_16310, partial [Longimicrobiales bacterium]|nr:hypothetical protein [Longimicrobiales bacterium]